MFYKFEKGSTTRLETRCCSPFHPTQCWQSQDQNFMLDGGISYANEVVSASSVCSKAPDLKCKFLHASRFSNSQPKPNRGGLIVPALKKNEDESYYTFNIKSRSLLNQLRLFL